jgi:hypothetical protein
LSPGAAGTWSETVWLPAVNGILIVAADVPLATDGAPVAARPLVAAPAGGAGSVNSAPAMTAAVIHALVTFVVFILILPSVGAAPWTASEDL